MKRILHLTFHCPINYGAILQTYALGVVLKRLGHSIKILDLRPPWMSPVLPPMSPGGWINRWNFHQFSKKYLPEKTRCYRSTDALANECKDIDVVVVGSDQVWNPQITRNFSKAYFLEFVPDHVRRISYAASFGLAPADWQEEFGDGNYGPLLKRYHDISVRETSGVDLCNYLGMGADVKTVLDPTLLLSSEDYIRNLNLKKNKFGIVSYRFSRPFEYFKMLENISFSTGEKVLLLQSRKVNGFENRRYLSPCYFLESILNSTLVVTDSFHVACFSIIFNKEFIVLPASKNRIGRLESLLNQLGIVDRLFFSEEEVVSKFKTIRKIDYAQVNNKLAKLKKSSFGFLSKTLA